MLSEKPDEVGNVFVAEVIGNIFYLIGGGKQVPFGFKKNVFGDQVGSRFADARFGDFIELVSGKVHYVQVLGYLLMGCNVLVQQIQKLLKPFLRIGAGNG